MINMISEETRNEFYDKVNEIMGEDEDDESYLELAEDGSVYLEGGFTGTQLIKIGKLMQKLERTVMEAD